MSRKIALRSALRRLRHQRPTSDLVDQIAIGTRSHRDPSVREKSYGSVNSGTAPGRRIHAAKPAAGQTEPRKDDAGRAIGRRRRRLARLRGGRERQIVSLDARTEQIGPGRAANQAARASKSTTSTWLTRNSRPLSP